MTRFIPIYLAAAAPLPWICLRAAGFHGDPIVETALTGIAILGAAFLLAWAAEVAQLDISASLAIALLSFIAVLPEYAVDIYFAWQAGKDPAYAAYAVANMTGANRLLIGVGWSTIVLLAWWKSGKRLLSLDKKDGIELGALTAATAYAFVIPFKETLSIFDTIILIGIFVVYIRATARQGVEDPHLIGPAEALSTLSQRARRVTITLMFLYAAAAILLSAEPFAEGLVATGKLFGVDEFLLVQWIAPLASEAPEFIIASLFALQGNAGMGLRAMISSKVNQWTLLIGMLPLAYMISKGSLSAMSLDARQSQEILLTVAQSAFAVAILAKFRFTVMAAIALLALFLAQFFLPAYHGLFIMAYIVLTLVLAVIDRTRISGSFDAIRTFFTGEAVVVPEQDGERAASRARP